MNNNRRGFTLTEVLLVSAMFAVISLAVFNAFSNGFKLWARGQHVMVEGDAAIFLDRITEDLRQTALISGIPFKGNSMEVSFPAVILGPLDNNSSRAQEGIGSQLGAIHYVYDPYRKKIFRYQANYGQALKGQWADPVEVAELIEGVTMRFYFKADRGVTVKDEVEQDQGTNLPMGVMIDVQYLVSGQTFHMRRFMVIPVGGGI